MSNYIVTDLVTNEIYPADTHYDVEQAVTHLLGESMTETEENEFAELLSDLILFDQGEYNVGTLVYTTLDVSVRSTE